MTAGNSKKRPRGLKASSSSTPTESTYDSQPTKKVRSTVESDLSSTSQSDDGSRTIMMPDVEEGNEIAETQALFDMAMDKLVTQKDIENGILLLRATIHECDRIIRLGELQDPCSLASLYVVYGNALLELSNNLHLECESSQEGEVSNSTDEMFKSKDDMEISEYLSAICDKISTAQDLVKDIKPEDRSSIESKIDLLDGRYCVKYCMSGLSGDLDDRPELWTDEKGQELIKAAIEKFDRVASSSLELVKIIMQEKDLAEAKSKELKNTIKDLVDMAWQVQMYGDFVDNEEEKRTYNIWAANLFDQISQESTDPNIRIPALLGYATAYSSIGSFIIQSAAGDGSLDEDEDAEEETNISFSTFNKAKEYSELTVNALDQAIKLFDSDIEQTLREQVYSLMAETQLNLGALYEYRLKPLTSEEKPIFESKIQDIDFEKQSNHHYAEALRYFGSAKDAGADVDDIIVELKEKVCHDLDR